MDSKTRVLNALNGKSIDRLPMWYGAEPALTEKIARHLGVQGEEWNIDDSVEVCR